MSPPTVSAPQRPAAGVSRRRRRPRSAKRLLARITTVLILLAAAFYLGGGWYFSNEIRDGITVTAPSYDMNLRVDGVAPGSVTLRPVGKAPVALDTDKVYGLDWGTGAGLVGPVLRRDGVTVTRALTGLTGPPPRVGGKARLLKEAFADPMTALHLPLQNVSIRSGDHDQPAWLVAGPSETWAVLVHGKGATRGEMLRLMRATTALGLPSLDITYRRDAESGGGLMRFGQDEWPDLEAAVQYALDNGARDVVLVGCSSGAAVSASFLENSVLRRHVVALVLDSPNLDFGATVEHGAADRTLPPFDTPVPSSLVWVARQIAGVRFGIDPRKTDYLDDTDWLTVPTLVFHGVDDDTVPYPLTERLAAAEPTLVTYRLVEGAGHVESWNVIPQRYDRTVRQFLAPYGR